MTSITLPPCSIHFNSMPSIIDSNETLKQRCSSDTFNQACRLFVKHNVHDVFGIALTHQHFDLAQDERLVISGNVGVPVSIANFEGKLAASRWAFSKGQVVPYEFTFAANELDMDAYKDFLHEFNQLLDAHGLSENVGICTVDSIANDASTPTMEFTSGRANITLPFDAHPSEGGSVDASWQVIKGDAPGMVVFGQCKNRCSTGPNTGHTSRHKYTRS